ncbi:MAG: GAF domain-containing protein, partial [Saprospiraceae bacterium]|nr:GAF domain-containing protein [Saprospiraceae bacterium]
MIYSIVQWRTRQLHEKHRELELMVNERTAELKQRVDELAVINSVQDGLASKLDLQAIYDLVGDKIRDVFDAQGVAISFLDRATNQINNPYYLFEGQRINQPAFEFGKGMTSKVIRDGQPLLINEKAADRFKEFGAVFASSETEASVKSWLGVPLISAGKVNGIIKLENYNKEFAYSEGDVSLLQTLANSMSVALENARLFDETNRLLKETEQRTAELAVINSVQEGLARELDMQGIYDLVGERVQKLFNAEVVIIASFDQEYIMEYFNYRFEDGRKNQTEPRMIGKLRRHLIEIRKKIVINTRDESAAWFGSVAVPGTKPMVSGMFIPLTVGEKVTGYVSLQNLDQEFAFSESDIRLLETLSNSMSVALENARLFDETNRLLKETEQRTAELAVINSVQEGLARELDLQGIYNLIGDRVQQLFNAQAVIIASLDLESRTEHFNYVFENNEKVKISSRPINNLRQLLIDRKQVIYISTEAQASNEYGLTPIEGTQMPKSLLFVPLLTGQVIKGYVSLQNIDLENAFSHSDIRLLETLANSMSVALENARLFDETNRLLKETEQRTAELAVINSVQDGLAKELDIRGIYNLVGDRLCELFPDSQTLVIRTFEHETSQEHWQYAKEKGVRQYVHPRPFNWNSKQLILSKKPLDIKENYIETAVSFGGTGVTAGQPPKSALFVPMIVGDLVKGSISLQNVDTEFAFNESDLRLLTTLTNSMSVALENARLFDETNRLLKETEQRTAELAVINSVQEGLARELDMQGIYDLIGDRVQKLFNAQAVIIATLDLENQTEHFNYVFENNERVKLEPRPI